MRVGRWFGDGTDNQQANNQQKLSQEKRSHQASTSPARCLGNQPSDSDGEDKNGNSQDLCGIYPTVTDYESADDHDVTGYVRCEDAKAQESDQVDHARDCAEQGREPRFQSRGQRCGMRSASSSMYGGWLNRAHGRFLHYSRLRHFFTNVINDQFREDEPEA